MAEKKSGASANCAKELVPNEFVTGAVGNEAKEWAGAEVAGNDAKASATADGEKDANASPDGAKDTADAANASPDGAKDAKESTSTEVLTPVDGEKEAKLGPAPVARNESEVEAAKEGLVEAKASKEFVSNAMFDEAVNVSVEKASAASDVGENEANPPDVDGEKVANESPDGAKLSPLEAEGANDEEKASNPAAPLLAAKS